MKVADLIKISYSLLKVLHENGMRVDDVLYLEMYEEYLRMKAEGHKTSYAVLVLSERYKMCERKVYKVLHRFVRECRFGAS